MHGQAGAVNPARTGTKAAAHYELTTGGRRHPRGAPAPGRAGPGRSPSPISTTCSSCARTKPTSFTQHLQADLTDADARLVQRQAFAGMLWSKQFYYYDVPRWLAGDPALPPPPPERLSGRNSAAGSTSTMPHIISMPDTWEYPWYAAWDLAFHCLPLAQLDAEFAKDQLLLLCRDWYMHPNGQLPAYEWKLSDVNPPVHA